MSDQFKDWDTYYRHFTLTQDPHKALRWTRHEMKLEKKRVERVKAEAEKEVRRTTLAKDIEAVRRRVESSQTVKWRTRG